jgi:hypothetical protein
LIKYIGKDSNVLEDVEAGLVHSEQSAYTEYPDAKRDEWERRVVPALKRISLAELQAATGLSRRMLIKARAGQTRPHPRNRTILTRLVHALKLI